MKKNFLSALIVFIMAMQLIMPISFAEIGIVIEKPRFDGGKIKVSATVDQQGKRYSMLVVSKGGDPKNISDRYAMCEELSNDDKKVTFIFKMPETRESLKTSDNPNGYTDGTYTITVKGNGTSKAELDFEFATEANKSQVIGKLTASSNSTELENYLKEDALERTVLTNIGFDFSKYDTLTPALKSEIASIFFANMPSDGSNIETIFNSTVKMVVINNDSSKVAECLTGSNYTFEGKCYDDLDTSLKNWVVRVYEANRVFGSIADIEKTYKIANVLYKINHSKYDTVANTISNYVSDLGIATDATYIEYKNLNSANKLATGEKLIKALSATPATSVSALIAALKTSIAYMPADKEDKYTGKVESGFIVSKTDNIGEIKAGDIHIAPEIFTDISNVTWAKDAIKYLYNRKIISGMGDGTFNPNGLIKREEFAKMAVEAIGVFDSLATSDFYDVEPNLWYSSYVASAFNNGIISGIGDGHFGVGINISRQDVAVIIARCAERLGIRLENGNPGSFDDDNAISDYAKDSIYSLYASNIISGMGENRFEPTGSCTRAQAARLIYTLLTYVQGEASEEIEIDAELAERFKFLSGLGMFDGATMHMIDANATILKAKFIQNAMRLVCGEDIKDDDLLGVAKGYGIASSDDYDYDEKMSFDEAVSVILRLSSMETYDDVNSSVVDKYKFEITRNTSEKGDTPITIKSVINLLYDAAKYKGVMIQSAPMTYILADNTIIEKNRNIIEVRGIITDTETTSINGASTVREGEIKIDGITALEGISEASKYLGKSVIAYIYFGDDYNKIIYVKENGNCTELTIPADDFDAVDDVARTIKYENGNRTKTVKYSPTVRVIKNGKYCPDYTKSDIEISNGSIRLIDNDGDNIYDIIFIEKYRYIVVSGVISSKNVIRSIYTKNTTTIPHTFDFYEVENPSIIYRGEKVGISDIQQNDVLSIMSTGTNSDDVVIIYVSRDKISGKITGKNPEENEISINGVVYKCSDAFLEAGKSDALSLQDGAYVDPDFNVQYDFYLDYFGKIAYIEESKKADEFSYVYAKKVYKFRQNGEEVYGLQYFTLNSEWKKTEFAEKVRLNGTSYKKDDLVTALGTITADVYKIQINDDKIVAIYDPTYIGKQSVTGKWSINSFCLVDTTKGGGILAFLDGSSKVFLTPTSGEDDEYAVGDRGRFSSDQEYTITCYGLDDFKKSDVVVYTKDTSVSGGSSLVVAERMVDTLINEEVLPVLYGVAKGSEKYTVAASKAGVFAGINKGDLIVMNTNAIDRAENAVKIFSASDYGTKMTAKVLNSSNALADSEFNKGAVFAAGFVSKLDYTGKKMIVDTGTAGGQIVSNKHDTVKPTVFIYDRANDTIELGNVDDIVIGDYIFMRFSWTRLETAYIIR